MPICLVLPIPLQDESAIVVQLLLCRPPHSRLHAARQESVRPLPVESNCRTFRLLQRADQQAQPVAPMDCPHPVVVGKEKEKAEGETQEIRFHPLSEWHHPSAWLTMLTLVCVKKIFALFALLLLNIVALVLVLLESLGAEATNFAAQVFPSATHISILFNYHIKDVGRSIVMTNRIFYEEDLEEFNGV